MVPILMVSPEGAAAVLPDAAGAVLVEAEEPPQAVRAAALPRTADALKSRREIIFIILFSFIRISQHFMEYTYMYVPWFLFVL